MDHTLGLGMKMDGEGTPMWVELFFELGPTPF